MDSPFSRFNSIIDDLPRSKGTLDGLLIARLVVAALLLAAAAFLGLKPVFRIILCVLAAIAAGYDVVLDLLDAVMETRIFSAPVILVLVTVLSFVIGRPYEGPLLLIIYQLGLGLLGFAVGRTKRSALELLDKGDEDLATRASIVIENEVSAETDLSREVQKAASAVLKVLAVCALLFAIVMPIVTSLSVKESIHRALILLTLSLPFAALASFPMAGIVGVGFATRFGVLFNSTAVMEKLQRVDTAVLDKSGIFTDNQPEFIGIKSEILDDKTFMEFVAHSVYYSDQAFAKAILAAEDREFQLDLISDFKDIPGSGVDLKINGLKVTLAKRELLTERGEAVPYEPKEQNSVYYMIVEGKYIGKVLLSENLNENNERLIPELKAVGIRKCVLLTEDSKEESESLGKSLNADEVYAEFTDETKLAYLESVDSENTMYLYANSLQKHSSASVDIRVSKKGKYADALVSPDRLERFPKAIRLTQRVREICAENAIIAFVVKALLVFLALTGHCTIWFASFLEMAVALAAILNAIRVTKAPLVQLPKL